MVTPEEIDLITTEEAAAMLKYGPETLRKWRMEKRYLPYYPIGAKGVRYDKRDVLEFIASRRTEPERGNA